MILLHHIETLSAPTLLGTSAYMSRYRTNTTDRKRVMAHNAEVHASIKEMIGNDTVIQSYRYYQSSPRAAIQVYVYWEEL